MQGRLRPEGTIYHYAEVPYLDQIFHGIAKKTVNTGLKESHDASVDLKLVRCLPTKIYVPGGDNNFGLFVMAPIMEMPRRGNGQATCISAAGCMGIG